MDYENIIKNALNLSPSEKIFIIDVLSKSLTEPDKNIEDFWKDEVEKRFDEFTKGKVKKIPYDKIVKNDN